MLKPIINLKNVIRTYKLKLNFISNFASPHLINTYYLLILKTSDGLYGKHYLFITDEYIKKHITYH